MPNPSIIKISLKIAIWNQFKSPKEAIALNDFYIIKMASQHPIFILATRTLDLCDSWEKQHSCQQD